MTAKTAKILIIDSNLKIQKVLRDFLEKENFKVLSAYNAKEGLEIANFEQPSVIFLDILLSGEDGLDLLKRLDQGDLAEIPKIVLTNEDHPDKKKSALENGAVDYLLKSEYRLEDLLRLAKLTLSRRQEAEEGKMSADQQGLVVMLNDDEFLLHIFENIFEEHGFKFQGFNTIPPQDIPKTIIGSERPKLIIVDLVMCFDGIAVIKALKSSEYKDIPIVILDNLSDDDGIAEDIRAGILAYIPLKNYTPKEAVEKIIKLLGKIENPE